MTKKQVVDERGLDYTPRSRHWKCGQTLKQGRNLEPGGAAEVMEDAAYWCASQDYFLM